MIVSKKFLGYALFKIQILALELKIVNTYAYIYFPLINICIDGSF